MVIASHLKKTKHFSIHIRSSVIAVVSTLSDMQKSSINSLADVNIEESYSLL